MAKASKANLNQAAMRVDATGGADASISFCRYDQASSPGILYTYKRGSDARIIADINLADHYSKYKALPMIRFSVGESNSLIQNVNIAFIDNTSPSIQSVDVSQSGDQLVVKLNTNEGVRWSSDMADQDLNDI